MHTAKAVGVYKKGEMETYPLIFRTKAQNNTYFSMSEESEHYQDIDSIIKNRPTAFNGLAQESFRMSGNRVSRQNIRPSEADTEEVDTFSEVKCDDGSTYYMTNGSACPLSLISGGVIRVDEGQWFEKRVVARLYERAKRRSSKHPWHDDSKKEMMYSRFILDALEKTRFKRIKGLDYNPKRKEPQIIEGEYVEHRFVEFESSDKPGRVYGILRNVRTGQEHVVGFFPTSSTRRKIVNRFPESDENLTKVPEKKIINCDEFLQRLLNRKVSIGKIYLDGTETMIPKGASRLEQISYFDPVRSLVTLLNGSREVLVESESDSAINLGLLNSDSVMIREKVPFYVS